MGILIDAIKAFDPSGANYSAAQEILAALTEVAEVKADMHLNEIRNALIDGKVLGGKSETESLYFPITQISDIGKQFRYIGPNTNNTEIPNHIADAIKDMIDESAFTGLVNSIAKLIYTDLTPILNVTDGQEKNCATTTIFVEGCGLSVRIARFDCIISAKSVQANTLQNTVKTIVTGVAMKSIIDTPKLSLDDFQALYTTLLEFSDNPDHLGALKKACEIYRALDGGRDCPFPFKMPYYIIHNCY